MTKNTFFALIFFLFFFLVACWKWWAWLLWKILRLNQEKQVFNLIGKDRFIEITGSSGKGKSWLLCHLFKHLQGVKFTNLPTPQGTYTLSKATLETHMEGRWGAPNKFYYFLDDVEKFQKWGKKQFQRYGYKELQSYIAQAAKCGGVFLWTNNGIEPEHIFKTQKNSTWRVMGHINFNDCSLLLVMINNWQPSLIPVDNKEIESFYDPHWNVPKKYQENWLTYIAQRMKGEELKDIIAMVKQKKDQQDWDKDLQVKWNLLNNYVRYRSHEEKKKRQQKQNFSNTQKQLKRYGLKTEPLTFKDIKELDKIDKQELKRKAKDNKDDKVGAIENAQALNEQTERDLIAEEIIDHHEPKDAKSRSKNNK